MQSGESGDAFSADCTDAQLGISAVAAFSHLKRVIWDVGPRRPVTASRPAVPAKVTPEPQSVLLLLSEASAGCRRWDGGRCHVVTPWQGGHGGDPCVIGWTDSWGSAGGPTLGPAAGG